MERCKHGLIAEQCAFCRHGTAAGGRAPRVLSVSPDVLDELRFVQHRARADWPAVFSCNSHRRTWVFATYGYTQEEDRIEVEHPLLAKIVDIYLGRRPSGGRFFLDHCGAYYQEEAHERREIVRFELPLVAQRYPDLSGQPQPELSGPAASGWIWFYALMFLILLIAVANCLDR